MEYYDNSKRPKKPMTEEQALLKLTTLCTKAEHCSQEMLDSRKGTVRQNKKEADGFCRKRKAKKNCGRNFPKRKPAAVLFV